MKLIKLINNRYFLFSVLLYLIFLFQLDVDYSYLYFYNFFSFILFYNVIRYQLFRRDGFYSTIRLSSIIFVVGFVLILVNNILSYYYNDNFFVFSAVDAGTYHTESLKMISQPLNEGINNFLKNWLFEDLGAVLVVSSLYRIIASNLIVNIFYLIISIYTGLGLFKIGRYLMPVKYAYFSALTFSISSFFIWFNSSGLKESTMIFLITYTFLHYYNFLKTRSNKYLLYLTPYLISLFLFRPVIVFLILGSILVSSLLRSSGYSERILAFIIIIGLIFGSNFLNEIYFKYLTGGEVSQMIASREAEGMVKGSLEFTYLVNILAGLIGPFPTILPNIRPDLSFYAPGLIFKILISIPFWFGVYYIFKRKMYLYYPIVLLVVVESVSLIFILEGLELRKSIPHFPFVYIVSFGFISYLDSFQNFNILQRKNIYSLINISFLAVFVMIIYWNMRN